MCVSVHIHVSQQVHGDRKTMIWTQSFHFHWYPGIKVRLSSGDDVHWLWSLLWSNQLKTLYFRLFNYFVLKNIYMKSNLRDSSRTRKKELKPLESRKKQKKLRCSGLTCRLWLYLICCFIELVIFPAFQFL